MSGLIATIERRPQAAFAAFLAPHVTVWTALPTLLYPNLPLDLIEALTYGREWQLGYDKLPPLPWWLVELVYRTVGVDAAYYALAQIAVVAAFAAVWLTARPLVGGVGALVAVLFLDGLHYFHFTAAKFNHDVIELPLWAFAGYAFHAALRRGRMAHWLLLGIAIGLSLWAKYFVVVLAAPLALFLLVDRDARRALATAGPWIARALRALARAHRSRRASAPLRRRPIGLYAAGAADRRRRRLAAAQRARRGAAGCGQGRRLRPAHRHALGLRPGGHHRRHVGAQRPRRHRHVGLSAVAVSRALDRALCPHRARARASHADRRGVGERVCSVRDRLCRELLRPAGDRPSLPRGVLSGRSARRRTRAPLSRRHRRAPHLRHRHDVGRRQRRPLRARAAAGVDRRRLAPRALDRSRRFAQQGRGGGVDRQRSDRDAGRPARRRGRRPDSAAVHAAVPPRRSRAHRRLGDPAAAAGVRAGERMLPRRRRIANGFLRHRFDHARGLGEHLLDLAFAHDQRRCEHDGFAGGADHQILLVECFVHGVVGALADLARPRA